MDLPDGFGITSGINNNDLSLEISGKSTSTINERNISFTINAYNTINGEKIQIIEPIKSEFWLTIKRRI